MTERYRYNWILFPPVCPIHKYTACPDWCDGTGESPIPPLSVITPDDFRTRAPRWPKCNDDANQLAELSRDLKSIKEMVEAYVVGSTSAPTAVANAEKNPTAENPTVHETVSSLSLKSAGCIANQRMAVIEPLLKRMGMTKNQWATEAGYDPSVVYQYCHGRSNPFPKTRKELAQVLGLDRLPD